MIEIQKLKGFPKNNKKTHRDKFLDISGYLEKISVSESLIAFSSHFCNKYCCYLFLENQSFESTTTKTYS